METVDKIFPVGTSLSSSSSPSASSSSTPVASTASERDFVLVTDDLVRGMFAKGEAEWRGLVLAADLCAGLLTREEWAAVRYSGMAKRKKREDSEEKRQYNLAI